MRLVHQLYVTHICESTNDLFYNQELAQTSTSTRNTRGSKSGASTRPVTDADDDPFAKTLFHLCLQSVTSITNGRSDETTSERFPQWNTISELGKKVLKELGDDPYDRTNLGDFIADIKEEAARNAALHAKEIMHFASYLVCYYEKMYVLSLTEAKALAKSIMSGDLSDLPKPRKRVSTWKKRGGGGKKLNIQRPRVTRNAWMEIVEQQQQLLANEMIYVQSNGVTEVTNKMWLKLKYFMMISMQQDRTPFSKWKPFYIAPGGGDIKRIFLSLSQRKLASLMQRSGLEYDMFQKHKLQEKLFRNNILPKYINLKKLLKFKILAPNFLVTDGVACHAICIEKMPKKKLILDHDGHIVKGNVTSSSSVPHHEGKTGMLTSIFPDNVNIPVSPSNWFVCDPGVHNIYTIGQAKASETGSRRKGQVAYADDEHFFEAQVPRCNIMTLKHYKRLTQQKKLSKKLETMYKMQLVTVIMINANVKYVLL